MQIINTITQSKTEINIKEIMLVTNIPNMIKSSLILEFEKRVAKVVTIATVTEIFIVLLSLKSIFIDFCIL